MAKLCLQQSIYYLDHIDAQNSFKKSPIFII